MKVQWQVTNPSTANSVPTIPYALTDAEELIIRSAVTSQLKDPLSALFPTHPVAFKETNGMIRVCGYVNAKNSFGGYTGQKPYYGMLAKGAFIVIGMGGTDIETMVVLSACERYGIYPNLAPLLMRGT